MRTFDETEKLIENYKGLQLSYDIGDNADSYNRLLHERNYVKVREALDEVGVLLDISNGTLSLSINSYKYVRVKNRMAGVRCKRVSNPDKIEDGVAAICHYSDIVYWMQIMTNAQICEKTGMKSATFYRHKKRMVESLYYKQLDKNKLSDIDYLESVPGNILF